MRRRALALGSLLLLAGIGSAPAQDTPAPATRPPVAVTVTLADGRLAYLTTDALDELPSVSVTASFATEHGPRRSVFEGPLLWSVLRRAGAIDEAHPREQVRLTVLATGRDGYTAVLAMGEIAPEFEAKQVLLAAREDGQTLGAEHLRLVVPGDKRGGRSVRDLVGLAVGRITSER